MLPWDLGKWEADNRAASCQQGTEEPLFNKLSTLAPILLSLKDMATVCQGVDFQRRVNELTDIAQRWKKEDVQADLDDVPLVCFLRNPAIMRQLQ